MTIKKTKYGGDERREIIYVNDQKVERGIKVETVMLALMIGIGGLTLWFIKDMATNIQILTERSITTKVKLDTHLSSTGVHRQ